MSSNASDSVPAPSPNPHEITGLIGQTVVLPRTPKANPSKILGRDTYRALVWLIVAVLAVIVWFAAPNGGTSSDWSTQMSSAEANKTINDASTEGAPQQQVVNGWYVTDSLPVLSAQASALHTAVTSGRIPSLMLLFGLGFCADVVGCSLGRSALRRREKKAEATASASTSPAP